LDPETFIHDESDKCVKCGLCLPHCPTYTRTRNEADSPRGRIALLQGWVEGGLALSPRLRAHLDGCLTCRACEHRCPSTVRFGQLMDAGRALMTERNGTGADNALQDRLTRRLRGRQLPLRLLRLYQKTGAQWLARRSGLLERLGAGRLDRYLPRLPRSVKWRSRYEPQGTRRGDVALFTGCMAPFDQATLRAAVRLLTQWGYRVHVPQAQVCCGAMDQHTGNPREARRLAMANRAVFDALQADALVFTASGCGVTLGEYGILYGEKLTIPVMEISRFLQQAGQPENMTFLPLKKKVAVHDPCTLTHVLRAEGSVYDLLARIPEIQLMPLPDNATCCGAAGSYMLTQPEMADALLADKIGQLEAIRPDILLTSNTGCALHLQAGIREAGLEIEVMHPVTLIEKQSKEKNSEQR